MRENLSAAVIGDGPSGLASAIVLLQNGYDIDFLSERDGLYTRTQVLRFSKQDFARYAKLFLGINNGEDIEHVNREMALLKGKDPARNKAFVRLNTFDESRDSDAYSQPGNHRLTDRAERNVFRGENEYVSIKIKHLEQAMFARLKQLQADPNYGQCNITNRKRQKKYDDAGNYQGKDSGAVDHVTPDGRLFIKSDSDQAREAHPDIIIAADGAHSFNAGFISIVNEQFGDDDKPFHQKHNEYRGLVNPIHSVCTYDIEKDSAGRIDSDTLKYIDYYISGDGGSLPPNAEPIEWPTQAELDALGWKADSPPSLRIFPAKDSLYIGAETPQSIHNMPTGNEADIAAKRQAVENWHKLVLRFALPQVAIDKLYRKKATDDKYAGLNDAEKAKRKVRDNTQAVTFEVPLTGGIEEVYAKLGKTIVLNMGDVLEGNRTHYQTATGADFGLKSVEAMHHKLLVANGAEERLTNKQIKDYEQQVNKLRVAKSRRTRAFGLSQLVKEPLSPTVFNDDYLQHAHAMQVMSGVQFTEVALYNLAERYYVRHVDKLQEVLAAPFLADDTKLPLAHYFYSALYHRTGGEALNLSKIPQSSVPAVLDVVEYVLQKHSSTQNQFTRNLLVLCKKTLIQAAGRVTVRGFSDQSRRVLQLVRKYTNMSEQGDALAFHKSFMRMKGNVSDFHIARMAREVYHSHPALLGEVFASTMIPEDKKAYIAKIFRQYDESPSSRVGDPHRPDFLNVERDDTALIHVKLALVGYTYKAGSGPKFFGWGHQSEHSAIANQLKGAAGMSVHQCIALLHEATNGLKNTKTSLSGDLRFMATRLPLTTHENEYAHFRSARF